MNDKKQIEELARDIGEVLGITYEGEQLPFRLKTRNYLAEELVNKGYRKIPEDSVAITKEELKKIIQEEYQNALKDKVVIDKSVFEPYFVDIHTYNTEIAYRKALEKYSNGLAVKEFAQKVKSKIKELRRKYHEDCINGLGDEEYNGITENNVDELLKEMGVE